MSLSEDNTERPAFNVCADWLQCLSSRSPPSPSTHLSNLLLFRPPHHLSICLILSVTHPFLSWHGCCLSACAFVFCFSFEHVLIFSPHTHTHTYVNSYTSHPLFCLSPFNPNFLKLSTFCANARHRQTAHLLFKLLIRVITSPMSTPSPWAVRPRTRPPTWPTLPVPPPPITRPQHAATFPAR